MSATDRFLGPPVVQRVIPCVLLGFVAVIQSGTAVGAAVAGRPGQVGFALPVAALTGWVAVRMPATGLVCTRDAL